MSAKNETTILILSFLITTGLIGSGFWWFANRDSTKLGQIISSSGKNTSATIHNGTKFASVKNIPQGRFYYGGSTTWAPIRRDIDSIIKQELPQFKIIYKDPTTGAPGSGTGIKMLLQSQIAFSHSSRPLRDKEYQKAQLRGFALEEIPVAIDGIAIAVNPKLDVPGLTLTQIKEIYTGKINNWQELGGPNLQIKPYSRRLSEGGTVEFFFENILNETKFNENVEFIPTTTQALRAVNQNLGGIYYASAPEVVGQCGVKSLPIGRKSSVLVPPYQKPLVPPEECPQQRNQLNSDAFTSGEYPITRKLFVIVKKNGRLEEEAGKAYANLLLSTQGQELITKAGFVKVR
ncbi:MAG: PstS family phosphate ABC transporter substrate-binding protein [Cyanobacteria bacterium P01_A01_bin.84]